MIRQGIKSAGYVAIFIDEVEHNDFITPELLKYIRDSKFVVVDLSHQNNGAYFEEGYAMGLGKPVIQLCKKDVRLHFDIAQKEYNHFGKQREENLLLLRLFYLLPYEGTIDFYTQFTERMEHWNGQNGQI